MAQVQQINIVECECYHRQGLIGAMFGLLWGPCRQCRPIMNGNVIFVPTNGVSTVAVSPGMTRMRGAPVVVSRSTQYATMPQPTVAVTTRQGAFVPQAQTAQSCQEASEQVYPSTLPPKYSEKVPIQ